MPTSKQRPATVVTRIERRIILAVCIALVGWLVYLNSLANPFVFDDHRLIVANHSLRDLDNLGAVSGTT